MRSVNVCLIPAVLALVACKSVTSDGRDRPPTAPSETPPPVASSPIASSDAGVPAPPVPEAPLAWGTRPAAKGPLFAVVDGMCVHGEIWPTGGSALYTYGNGTGPWTRGSDTTLARFVDDGLDVSESVTKTTDAEAWSTVAPFGVEGTWPTAVLYSSDQGNGRMRDWPSIWTHGDGGWKLVASHREAGSPDYLAPTIFRRHVVSARRTFTTYDEMSKVVTFKAVPLEKDAPPIENLAALGRAGFFPNRLVANETTLFALGGVEQGSASKPVLRVLAGGAGREIAVPEGEIRVLSTRPSLVLQIDKARIARLDGDKLVAVDVRLPAKETITSASVAPNGDVWILPSGRKSVIVARADGKLDELALPAAASPRPKEAVQHWPMSGAALAGVDVDDPYVIGEGGSLFHFAAGQWREVELPEPPFAATGKYQAQAVVVPSKGDVYVNAGYAEKGVGWKTVERYRAVLRNKRPKEVLRCNEPWGGSNAGSGRGFMSFPPLADESCATPFVVLLRTAYALGSSYPVYVYDRKSDYPSVRAAIKATPGLGASVDLVEVVSGTQRYLGARVPNVAAGRELAAAVAKKVTAVAETRPEIVCGTPKEDRLLHVDVATGKVATPIEAR
ncbi:MAG: hypothetical protein KF764_11410 [Labilithrix sp.]|nr:hypothetical protein [Labilithrix sp.]